MADNTRKRPEFLDDALPPKAKDPGGDPLAELARLIGQSDPFADKSPARKPVDAFHADDRPAPEWLARPAAADRDEGEFDAQPAPHYQVQNYREQEAPAAYVPQPAQDDDSPSDYADSQHDRARYEQAAQEPQTYEPQTYEPQTYEPQTYAASSHAPDYQAEYQGDDRYRVAPPPPGDYDGDAYYAEDGHMPPQGEEHAAPNRRRGGIITIAAVLGLAVVGTAGAFGYRAFTSGSGAPANPPVIKADTTPAKIVPPPAAQATDAQGKPFQDRVGAPGAPERVVSREEQPVSLPTPPRAGAQSAPQNAFASAGTPPLAAPPPPAATNEPKRVKTMTIRPDGSESAPSAPQSATRPAAPKQQQVANSGPMAIGPGQSTQSAPPPSANTKVASRTTGSTAAPAGAYVVQVSAQRTEAEAQSSYRALQQKYPTVLGTREANIRRVDLGDKGGIFYRAQVGSFSTSEQAATFCNSLRDVGGQCIVQRN